MLVNWPGPFLFWTKVKNHEELKEKLYPEIIKGKENPKYLNRPMQFRKPGDSRWQCDVITTYFDREDVKDIFTQEIVEDIIGTPLDEMFADENYGGKKNPTQTNLTEIWYNIYEPGYYQEIHAHHGATFSGIYLFELNEPNTTAFFANQTQYEYARESNPVYKTEHIKEGNVLIFPSEFSHLVRKTSEFRITVSFNLKCMF